jgi:hypothetical protein
MKQTAVEWLVENIAYIPMGFEIDIIEQAKAMEKEQIIKAHGMKYYDLTEEVITGEQYYNETYNKSSV